MATLLAILWFVVLAISLRGVRWACVAFVVPGLAYFPVEAGIRLQPTTLST